MTPDLFAILQGSHYSPSTQRVYKIYLTQWIAFAGADPRGWTSSVAHAFVADAGNTAASTTTMIHGLNAVFRLAGLPEHLFDGVPIVRNTHAPAHPLTRERVQALLGACCGTDLVCLRDWSMVVLGLYTGLRRAQLAAVNLDAAERNDYVQLAGLISLPRVHPPVWDYLEPYRRALRDLGYRSGPLFRAVSQPLLDGQRAIGGALTDAGISFALTRRAKAVPLRAFRVQAIRETHLAWTQANGSELRGSSSPEALEAVFRAITIGLGGPPRGV